MSTSQNIAFRIRAELVCCNIYDEVNVCKAMTLDEAMASSHWHDLCYWGEAAAQLAEGRCPGRETVPNICECPCDGCKHNCAAHQGGPSSQGDVAADVKLDQLLTAIAVGSPGEEQTAKERDMLGREADRLRRDWIGVREQLEAAERRNRNLKIQLTEARAALLDFRGGLQVMRKAIEELPKVCRYHGVRTAPDKSGWMRESCCDTGLPAHRRKLAEAALAGLLNEGATSDEQ